mmetsp:Transcript_20847/g.28056  ORF Transcript_20847/g.28056 Transcript_20847/m.28056 type:complete len:81 (-) Transcript_20847:186-428(-)
MLTFAIKEPLPNLCTLYLRNLPPFDMLHDRNSSGFLCKQIPLRPQVTLASPDALLILPSLAAAVAELMATTTSHMIAAVR